MDESTPVSTAHLNDESADTVTATAVPTTIPPTPMPAVTEFFTVTPTNPPTNTPIPYVTVQSFPTVTPVGVYPVKQVLIQAGMTTGDSGRLQVYLGGNTPGTVIYTDGQVILKNRNQEEGDTFVTGQLPDHELCSLLGELDAAGFFTPFDTYYDFDETAEFGEGAPSYVIQVNGPLESYKLLYSLHLDYLIPEIEAAYQLVSTYQPPTTFEPYMPETLLLWVEPRTDLELDSLQEWPGELPPLSVLRADPSNSQITIVGELIQPFMALFENRMSMKEFREGEQGYRVILRPLLPNETPDHFSKLPDQGAEFNLPFTCENLDLPEIIPTVTPTSVTGTLAPEIAELRGRIVFSSNQEGNDEIYVMYADGTRLTRLTNYPGEDTEPVWSPDGQQIAFVSDRSGRDEIYIMNADGTGVQRLTYDPSDNHSPAWSPDSTRIAFVGSPNYGSEIYLVEVDGSEEPVQLTEYVEGKFDITPTWLDPNRIIYASGNYPDYDLYLIRDNGAGQTFLGKGSHPAISPDGRQLVYVSDLDGSGSHDEVFVVSISAFLANQASPFRITGENMSNRLPEWSPDGQHIVFVSIRDGNAELYVANADGSNPVRLTYTAAGEQDPDWAP